MQRGTETASVSFRRRALGRGSAEPASWTASRGFLDPETLTVIVNTGDDFNSLGARDFSPDLDTVMYTLAELSDDVRGLGPPERARSRRSRTFAATGAKIGSCWRLRFLATHLLRTEALSRGEDALRGHRAPFDGPWHWCRHVPMADAPCRTMLDTVAHGVLPFQEWFVRHRAPAVRRVWFEGDLPRAGNPFSAIERADVVVIVLVESVSSSIYSIRRARG